MTSHEFIYMLLGFSIALVVSNARKEWMIAKLDKRYRILLHRQDSIKETSTHHNWRNDPVVEAEKAHQYFIERPETQKKTDRLQA